MDVSEVWPGDLSSVFDLQSELDAGAERSGEGEALRSRSKVLPSGWTGETEGERFEEVSGNEDGAKGLDDQRRRGNLGWVAYDSGRTEGWVKGQGKVGEEIHIKVNG